MELESGYGETEVQPRVQDRGREAGDRAGRVGRPGLPGSGTGRERPAAREAAEAPISAFPGNGQQRAELAEIAALKNEVAKLRAERDILKEGRHWSAIDPSGNGDAFFAREAT